MSKILVIAAHPDDEVLGCGGTMAKLSASGNEVYSLILCQGITSRTGMVDESEKKIKILSKQMLEANKLLGVKKCFQASFPDNKFDTVPLLEIIKYIEEIKEQIKPDIIFTHFKDDLNIDHKKTFEAVITSSRPVKDETVKEIYSFEVLSSTEWNFPLTFSPNVFVDISEFINKKKSAMNKYREELRDFPHPRSIQGIELDASNWGMKSGLDYAEPFFLVRKVLK